MKIAVVCAVNSDRNPGMVTVDRAAKSFFSDRAIEVDWLIAGLEKDHDPGVADLSGFRSLFDQDKFPGDYDKLVFWGDFLQSKTHHESLARLLLVGGRAKSKEDAEELLRRLLLLEGAPKEVLEKVAIVGSSIHADTADSLIDVQYRNAMQRLLSNACSVRMREPLSAYRVSTLCHRDASCGMDAAFFGMLSSSWNEAAAGRRSEGPLRIAVVGGRAKRNQGRKLKFSAVSALNSFKSRGVEASLEVLPWLSDSLGRWGWFDVQQPLKVRSPEGCLQRLSDCDAILTDVYHAAINGWVLGIPVVLFGTGAELDTTTIQSKKKELLALSMFAGRNYLFHEDISYWNSKSLGNQIVDLLTDEERNRAIFEEKRLHAEWLWSTLEKEIDLPAKRQFLRD